MSDGAANAAGSGGPATAAPVLRDVMTTRVVVTSPDASIAAAAAAMSDANVGSAVVMEGSFLAGILTERDVLRAAASGRDLTNAPVSEWMTPDPRSAGPDTSVEEAVRIMFCHGFRHLPVVAGRGVCGMVSLRDLFAAGIRRPPQDRPTT